MPPVDRMFRWTICSIRHGAYAKPAPATSAPGARAPRARARAYAPIPARANDNTVAMLSMRSPPRMSAPVNKPSGA